MKELSIQGLPGILEQLGPAQAKDKNASGEDFEKLLLDSLKKVNNLQHEANQAVENLAAGKQESIHETMIALEKANVSFQMMMQIRNKILDAYQEIMKTAL